MTLLLQNAALENECDVAILLAADSDFVPPVELVKRLGKVVRNAYFSSRPSYHLQQACNGTPIRLDDIDFVYKDGNPRDLITLGSLKGAILTSRHS
ncbi:MAG: NYN domain-containing protein [Acidobacteria bacterium]|nr:NYN domain-containing protein [Acidobacteriota bacterium]